MVIFDGERSVLYTLTVVFDLHLEVVFMMVQLNKLEDLYPQKLINQITEEFLKTKKEVVISNKKFFIQPIYKNKYFYKFYLVFFGCL